MTRIVVPTLSAALMMAVLLGLGTWQLHRLHWKQTILAAIAHAEAAPAIALPPNPTRFEKVAVTGTLDAGKIAFYGDEVRDTPQGPVAGAQLIQPLRRPGAPPILIDRGWVPDQADPQIPTQAGTVTIDGYVRPPDHPGLFSAKDDPTNHRFYTLDPTPIASSLGLATPAPYTIIQLGQPSAPYPIPATELPRPPNDHFQYAMTWFGLAGALAVIYVQWASGSFLKKRTKKLP